MAVNGNLFPWKVPRPHSYSTPILASSRGIEPTSDRCVVRNNLKAHVIGLPVRKLEHLNRSTTIARAGCWRECLLSQYWASITSEAKRLIVDSLYDALLDRFLPNKHPCTNGAYCMDQRWTRFSLHAWQHIHRGKWTHYTCVACEVSMGIHTWQVHRHHKQLRLCNFSPFILMWHLIISRLWLGGTSNPSFDSLVWTGIWCQESTPVVPWHFPLQPRFCGSQIEPSGYQITDKPELK